MTEDMGDVFLAEREGPIRRARLASFAIAAVLWGAAIILSSTLLTLPGGSSHIAVSVFGGVIFFLMGLMPLARGLGAKPMRMRERGVENLKTGPSRRGFVPYEKIRFASVSTSNSFVLVTFHYRLKGWGAMKESLCVRRNDMQDIGLQDVIDFLISKGVRAGHEYELSDLEPDIDW